jgi:uncharacterized damage-inducible protein DinB
MMQMLAELFRYNVWANHRIVDACAALSDDQLRTPRADVYGSILDTLSHLISVEYKYLRMIRGEPTAPQRFADVAAARERCQDTDRAYIELVERLDELGLGRSFRMEGLGRDMTVGQGLLQVATTPSSIERTWRPPSRVQASSRPASTTSTISPKVSRRGLGYGSGLGMEA